MNHKYIPHTEQDIKKMLDTIGVSSIDDLFREVPSEIKLKRDYNFTNSLSELEVTKRLQDLASKNKSSDDLTCFIGAGAYDHYIPSVIHHITNRSEFYTAYTPYQPEVAQGTLQYIFEYQTMISNLTGMDVSNASMYDGATSTAEAMMMAVAKRRKNKVLVSKTIHPNTLSVLKTYAKYQGVEIKMIETKDGITSRDDLEDKIDNTIAGVIVQNPNFYGRIEDVESYVDLIHEHKSLLIMNVNPISLPVLKTPGEIGADIVCGDAQPLGIPLSFGGPYIGFLATTNSLMRKMPGRICGETTDIEGKRAFVLTLQAREQHIRREKANSNICSNQSLNALAVTVYLSTLGNQGTREVALQNIKKSHYAFKKISALNGFEAVYDGPFFNEFVIKSDYDYNTIKNTLYEKGIISGLHLGDYDNSLKNHILFCVTEKRTAKEIDHLVDVLGGLAHA
ncbi:aminomethyl-transferring glycine dehydrogenase subunit GcvPA [Haloplasma contractile]|uniref:Probable glycine dehydrogenase (decarboxylating) subunit 1 n=1 Tax=Haloplasma contractile SSD-17B TaxID=1033810 RepID=U2E0D1_9MOLU|nr:aminomethyl-transferring glycine dehydrogenase subunit GcvPA [Haloplasma contractile]ERJ13882.1 putative glycine dehydrogenase decarboxylating subunit 1 protein [Haloplasma contractile SSD-17B]